MTTGTETALTGAVALLERALGYTLGSLTLVTPEAMSGRTPCGEWDLRALLLHLNDSLLALHEAVAAGQVGLPPAEHGDQAVDPGSGDAGWADLVASVRSRASRMIGAWVNAAGPGDVSLADQALTAGIVAAAGAVDIAVHGWDIARACGHCRPLPAALAEELLDLCLLLVADADRPALFAAPVDVEPAASPSDRLVGFLGRRP